MDSAALRRVGAAFEGMLLQQCLAPMARGNGPLEDFGMSAIARTIAEHDAHGFGALLAAQLERQQQ